MITRCCKTIGLSCLTFCVGVIAGLLMPIYVVAIVEAFMIIIIGYLCLFRW